MIKIKSTLSNKNRTRPAAKNVYTQHSKYSTHSKHSKNFKPINITNSPWGRKVLLIIIFLLALIWSWLKLTNPLTFPIRHVSIVDNAAQLDHHILQETISPYIIKGMLMLDIPALSQALEQLAWVEHVVIKRKFPDHLLIQLIEKNPIACWNDTELLNSSGDIFMPDHFNSAKSSVLQYGQSHHLPSLYGPANRQMQAWQAYQEISAIIKPLGLTVSTLSIIPPTTCHIFLSNGLHIIAAENDELDSNSIRQLTAVYQKICLSHEQNIDYIDLRYSNGFAIHWKNSL